MNLWQADLEGDSAATSRVAEMWMNNAGVDSDWSRTRADQTKRVQDSLHRAASGKREGRTRAGTLRSASAFKAMNHADVPVGAGGGNPNMGACRDLYLSYALSCPPPWRDWPLEEMPLDDDRAFLTLPEFLEFAKDHEIMPKLISAKKLKSIFEGLRAPEDDGLSLVSFAMAMQCATCEVSATHGGTHASKNIHLAKLLA